MIFNAKEVYSEINHNYYPNGSQTNLILADGNETVSMSPYGIPNNYTLIESMRNKYFYVLWITFGLSTQSAYFIGAMIKAFGQSFISDDHYLAIILSLSFIVNGIGGVFWGKVLDYLKFQVRYLSF